MTAERWTREVLQDAARDGETPWSLARRAGVADIGIRRAEKRHGIRLNREREKPRDYRAAVQDMKPLDAVEYLLEVIAQISNAPPPAWVFPGVHLSKGERKLLFALAEARGRVLTKAALMSAYMAGREADDEPELKLIDVMICHLRRKLAGTGIEIVTAWGVGWSISAPDGFVWPWEATA